MEEPYIDLSDFKVSDLDPLNFSSRRPDDPSLIDDELVCHLCGDVVGPIEDDDSYWHQLTMIVRHIRECPER